MFEVIEQLRRLAERYGPREAATRLADLQYSFIQGSRASAEALSYLQTSPDRQLLIEIAMDLYDLADMSRILAREATEIAEILPAGRRGLGPSA